MAVRGGVAGLALCVVLAGCGMVGLDPAAACPEPMPDTPFELRVLPLPPEFYGQAVRPEDGPAKAIHWATVAQVRNATLPVSLSVSTGAPHVIRPESEGADADGPGSSVERNFIRPPGAFVVLEHFGSAASTMEISWALLVNSSVRPGELTFAPCPPGPVAATLGIGSPREGAVAQSGKGAHVWYAGFFENGTLFGTNIATVDESDWPRIGWYAGGDHEPIPVYVYDQDRSERPPHWGNPLAGTPAAGSPVDSAAGLGYYTTIPGFNDALKGLSNATTRVVRVAPEDAYTRPGNEGHPLYGHALVFLIRVDTVVSNPCPRGLADPGIC
jgi:hypothetical protein